MDSSSTLLSTHLRSHRIAHTYLLSGPEGETKTALALGFAKALNCEKEKGDSPLFIECDCPSCGKIERRSHPDVQWLGEDREARSLKIEEIRALLHAASLKPFEGRWKVFILQGAERLTLEAANALLKTLEEPPEHSVFLLLVENKAHLLETIQSRAVEIRTPPGPEKDPGENQAIRLLSEKGWAPFFETLRAASRPKLQEALEALLRYLRDQAALKAKKEPGRLKPFLKAIDSVYETQEAVDANVNQKLALTHLEIQLRKTLP